MQPTPQPAFSPPSGLVFYAPIINVSITVQPTDSTSVLAALNVLAAQVSRLQAAADSLGVQMSGQSSALTALKQSIADQATAVTTAINDLNTEVSALAALQANSASAADITAQVGVIQGLTAQLTAAHANVTSTVGVPAPAPAPVLATA